MTPSSTPGLRRCATATLAGLATLAVLTASGCSTPAAAPTTGPSDTGPATGPATVAAPSATATGASTTPTSPDSPGTTATSPSTGSSADPSSSTAPSADPSASTGPVACTTAALRIGLEPVPGGSGMGSTFWLLTFTNRGDAGCTLYGWPGVSLVGKGDGTQLGVAATRVQPEARRVVVLPPGRRTTALLKVSQARDYPRAQCGPVTADGFRVYPPGQRSAAFVARSTPACTKKSAKVLAVAPIGTTA